MEWNPLADGIEDIFHLPVMTQTLPPHRQTNSFLLGRRTLAMVDAGQWDGQGLDRLARFLAAVPGRRLARLFLTHWHPDHCVGAEAVKRVTGCRVGVPAYEAERSDPALIDFTFRDADRFALEGMDLEVVHTPGHSAGHCCFFVRSRRVLFTGDHILGLGTSIIVPPDGDMALYLGSLERLRGLSARVICPGHGPLVWEPGAKIRQYIGHRLERERNLLALVQEGVSLPEEMVRRAYTDVPESFHGMAFYTVLAHLEKLVAEGKVRKRSDGEGTLRYDPA